MSKEQTPIDKFMSKLDYSYEYKTKNERALIKQEIEVIVNSAVLKALEREIPIAHDKGFDRDYIGMNLNREVFPKGVQYYEIEVKPKYE